MSEGVIQMSVPAVRQPVRQLFDSELSHFRHTIEVAKEEASEANLQQLCQASRTVLAVLEQWTLIEKTVDEQSRKEAVLAHREAQAVLAGPIPPASVYIRSAVADRLEKTVNLTVKSLHKELKTILDSIDACSAP